MIEHIDPDNDSGTDTDNFTGKPKRRNGQRYDTAWQTGNPVAPRMKEKEFRIAIFDFIFLFTRTLEPLDP